MIWCTVDFEVWYPSEEDIPHYDEILEQIKYEKGLNGQSGKTKEDQA